MTCHEITEDDEFLVLACDGNLGSHYTHPLHSFFSDCSLYLTAGIWDCLSSQDVVNFVRYQVYKGKELTEIGEMICDHCLAPDSESSIGCDNMTVLIVAITHGRLKEDWYAWIAERVEDDYGYHTPSNLPRLYPESRLTRFRQTKEICEQNCALEEQRKTSTSAQSSPSSTQACSQSDPSAGSARKDELPEPRSKAETVTRSPDQIQNMFIKMALFVLKLLQYLLAMR